MDWPGLQNLKKEVLAQGIYRSLLNFAFLLAVLKTLPDHRVVVVIGFLAFCHGLAIVMLNDKLIAASQNRVDDLAERKTRHAVLLARSDESIHESVFWSEVDRRVREEFPEAPDERRWYKVSGAIAGRIAFRFAGDLLTVGLAMLVAG